MPVIIVQRRKALQPVWVPLPGLEEVFPEVPDKQQSEETFESWTEWYRRSVAAPLALSIKQAKLSEPWASLARGGVALLDQAGAVALGVGDLLRALVTRPGKTLGGIVRGIGQLPSIFSDVLQVGIAGLMPGGIAASPSAQRAYERLERLFGPQVSDLAEYRVTARDAAEREALEALQELYGTPEGAVGGAAGMLAALLVGSKGIGALGRGSRTALQATRAASRRAFLRGMTSELNRQALGLGGLTAASVYGQYTGPIIRGEMEPGAAMWEALASGATTTIGVRMFPPLRPVPSLGRIATVAAGEAAVNTLGTLLAHAPRIAVMTGKPEEYPTGVQIGPFRAPSEVVPELIAGIALPPALRALEGAQLRGVRGVGRRPGQPPTPPPAAPQQPSGGGLPVPRPPVSPVPSPAGGALVPAASVAPTQPQRPGGLPAPHAPAALPTQPVAGLPQARPEVASTLETIILPREGVGATAPPTAEAAAPRVGTWEQWNSALATLERRVRRGVNAKLKPLARLAPEAEHIAPEIRQQARPKARAELKEVHATLLQFIDSLRPEQRRALLEELQRRNLLSREIDNPHEIPLYVTGALSAGEAEVAARVIRAIREWMRKPEARAVAAPTEGAAPEVSATVEGSAVEAAESRPDIILPQEEGAGQPVAAQDVTAGATAPPTAGEGAPPAAVSPEAGGAAPAEPQATPPGGAEGTAPVRVRKTKGRTRKKATPQQAESAGPKLASKAEAPEQPGAPQPPETASAGAPPEPTAPERPQAAPQGTAAEDPLANFRRRAVVNIKLADGGQQQVNAAVWGPWAIHRNPTGRGYTLTHIPTGLHVARSDSRAVLAEFARELNALGDWSSSNRDDLPIVQGLDLRRKWQREGYPTGWIRRPEPSPTEAARTPGPPEEGAPTAEEAPRQQAESAGPETSRAAETPVAGEAGEAVAPTGTEAPAAASPPETAPETPPSSGLQPRPKAPEDAAKHRELLAQWRSSLLSNRLQELQDIHNRIRGRQLKANLRTVANWLQLLNREAGDKAINELQQAFVDTLGSLPVEALADPTEVALHWLATVFRRGNVRDALRQDVRDWWATIVGDENESRARLRAIEHMREALLRNDQEAQSILDQALPRSTQRVQTLYKAIERYIRESAPGGEVATALRRAFEELPAEAFTETQKIVSKFMPLVKEYGGEQGLEVARDLLRRTYPQHADLQHINEVYTRLAGLRSERKRRTPPEPESQAGPEAELGIGPGAEPTLPQRSQRGRRQVVGLPEVPDDGSVLAAELLLRNADSDEVRAFWTDEQRYRRERAQERDATDDHPVAEPLALRLNDIRLIEQAKDHLLKFLAPNVSDALRAETRYQLAKAVGLVGGTVPSRKQRARLILDSKTPEELRQALGTQWEELSKIVASLETQTQNLREAAKKQRKGKGGSDLPSSLMTPVVSAALAFAIDPDEDYFGIKGEELRKILIGMGAVGLGGLAFGMFFRRPATGTRLSGALHAAQHAADAAPGYLHALRTAAERWVDTQIRQGKIAAARRAEAIAQRIGEAKRIAAEYARGLPKRAGKWLLSVQGILTAASGGNPLAKRLYNALLNAEGIIRGTSVKQELDQWARTVTPELANAIAQEFLDLHERAILLAHTLNAKELVDRMPEEYARSIAKIRAEWGDEGAEAYKEFLGIARRVGMEHLLGLALRTGVISPDDADASAVFAALSQRTAQGLPADWGTVLVEYLKNKRAAYVGEYEEYRRYLRLLSPVVRRARQMLKQNQQFVLSPAEWQALYSTLPVDLVDRAGGMALSDQAAFIINLRQNIAQLAKQARRRIINVDRLLLYAQNPVPYVPHFWEDHPYVVSVRLRTRGTSPKVQALEKRVQALENQLAQAQSQAQPDPALVDALETELQLARQALERARASEGYVTVYRKTFEREKDWHAAVAELEQLARDPNWVIAQLSKQYDRVAALQAQGFQLTPDAIRPEDIIIDTGREAPRTTPTGRLRNAIIQLYSTARRGVYKGAFDVGSVAHALSRMLVPSVPELLKRENVQGWRPAAEDAWRWLYQTFEHMGERSGQRIRSSFIFSTAESVARELAEYGLYHTPAYDYVLGILDRYMVDPTRNLEIPRGSGLRVLLAASTMLGNVASAVRNIAYATAVSPLVWYRMREGIRAGEFEFTPHPMLSLVLDTHRIAPQDAFKLLDIGESSYIQHVRVPGKMEQLQDWTYALQRLTERFNNWVAYRIGVATYMRNAPDPDPAAAVMAGLAARRFTTGSYEWINQPAIERLLRQKVPLGEAFLALFSAARAQAEFVTTTLAWAARSGGMDRLRRLATVGGIMIAGSLLLGPQAYPVLGDLWKLFVELGDKASEDEPPLIRLGGREQWREWVRSIARALGADEDAVQLWADAATYGLISTLTNRNLQAYGTLSEFADILLISQAKNMARAFADMVKEGKVDPAQVAGLFNVTLRRIIRAADQVAIGQYKSADGVPLGVPYNEDDAFWEILTGRPLTEWKYREITGTGAVPMTAVERQMFISRLDRLPGLRLNIRPRSATAVALVKYAPEIFTDIRNSYIAIRPVVEGELEALERFINTREGARWLQEVAGVAGYDARRAKQFVGQLKQRIKEYYLSLIAHQTLRAYGIPSRLQLEARNGLEYIGARLQKRARRRRTVPNDIEVEAIMEYLEQLGEE